MTRQYFNRVLVLLLVFLPGSGSWSLLQAETLDTSGDGSNSLNLAVFVEGQVSVKKKGWTSYTPVVFGTSLRSGDLLRLDNSSHAKVVCSDLTLHDVTTGIVGVPCSVSLPLLQWEDGSTINVTRGSPNDGLSPIVLSPRRTKLLSPYPMLRWTPVPGAGAYSVAVRGPNLISPVQVGVGATETQYPALAPQLESGVDYKLIVQAGDQNSADEPGPGLGFSILNSKDRKVVEKQQKRIEDMELPNGPTQFLISYLYASRGLNAEAIQRLESVSQTFKVAAVERLLGGLYLRIGLPRQAEGRYLSSLDLSKSEKDEEGEMRDHLALAAIYEQALGNDKSARLHLDAALALAKKVGDDLTVNQAGKMLADLKM